MTDPKPPTGAAKTRAAIRALERATKRADQPLGQRPKPIEHEYTPDNRAVPVKKGKR